ASRARAMTTSRAALTRTSISAKPASPVGRTGRMGGLIGRCRADLRRVRREWTKGRATVLTGPGTQTRRARRPASLKQTAGRLVLPGVAGADVGAVGRAAGAGLRAVHGAGVGAGDDERAAGLRDGVHVVAVAGSGDGDLDLAGRGADRQAGARRDGAARVGLTVGEAGLDLRDGVTSVRLGGGVLALLLLAQERRQGDGGEDADDEDNDEELDKREARL